MCSRTNFYQAGLGRVQGKPNANMCSVHKGRFELRTGDLVPGRGAALTYCLPKTEFSSRRDTEAWNFKWRVS